MPAMPLTTATQALPMARKTDLIWWLLARFQIEWQRYTYTRDDSTHVDDVLEDVFISVIGLYNVVVVIVCVALL
jgi:hypothetical protein